MFGLLTRLCFATFHDRHCGQHYDQRDANVDTVDTDTDIDDIDTVDDDGPQSRRLQRHAPSQ